MALPNQASGENGRVVTLTESADIVATIGRPGLLENRVGAAAVARIPALRSDALLDHLRTVGAPVGAVVTSLHADLLAEPIEPQQTLDNLTAVAALLAEQDTQLFVYNVSTFDPTDRVHRFVGVPDTYAMRAHRLLAGLENQAGDAGINVIDVDGAVAEVGGIDTVPAPGALSGNAVEFVTEEAILAIDQSGSLGGTLQAPVMRLVVPVFDRRTKTGSLSKWHVAPGDSVSNGDPLFDFRFETRVHRFDLGHDDETRNPEKHSGRSKKAERVRFIDVTVVAGSDAYLHQILLTPGAAGDAGDVAAIMTTTPTAGH